MSRSNQDRLNGYFRSELDALRTSGREFARAHPGIAAELTLSAGVARDQHVEHLVQSFAWMMGRLRMQMEAETRKVPAMLLEQLIPGMVQARPSMAVVECEVEGSGADMSEGFRLKKGLTFAPLNVNDNLGQSARLKRCKFALPYATQLWPFKVVDVVSNPLVEGTQVSRYFRQARASLKIVLEVNEGSRLDTLKIDAPLRFFIDIDAPLDNRLYDFLASQVIGVAVSDTKGRIVKFLDASSFRLCGFDDLERMSGLTAGFDLGTSVLADFFAFPQKFLFFEITDLADLELMTFKSEGEVTLNLHLVFKDQLPARIKIRRDTFKINCVPVVNLFEHTTEPLTIHEKSYRYRLVPDRSMGEDIEVQKIVEVYAVDTNGVRHIIEPYFSVQDPRKLADDIYYVVEREESSASKGPGSDIWVSIFSRADFELNGISVYAKTLCNNRLLAEQVGINDRLAIIGTAPVKSSRLLSRPTRYGAAELDEAALWKLMATLSRHHVALAVPDSAKEALMLSLSLCAATDDDRSQNLMDSIVSFTAEDEYVPSRKGAWRGYLHGTKYQLVLNERIFDGSVLMIGRIVLHFLTLYSHVNSSSSLECFLGERMVHKWSPMTGHKILA